MANIWDFLLQTLSASGVALVLLAIKRLLRNKVSPDVQSVFWLALFFRILLPVRAGKSILFPFPVLVELFKAKVEQGLTSAYSGVYEPAGSRHILPVYVRAPQSVTDWLFVAYGIGAAFVLLGYALAYVCLRVRIARAGADEAQQARVEMVAAKYGLHSVRVRMAAGTRAPFVCGVFSPVLVLPEGQETDELVLLHELLHREHHDPAHSMCWCVLRALHWCNPFLWYTINRIENDLETRNDQRVLECIEGEARRCYGETLLAMAAGRYARMPGTSSISNGRKNIARRIEAIARFKKYPKGVTFAFVCIAVVLACAATREPALAEDGAWQHPTRADELDYALAKSRVRRCSTAAGALDTYAKGMLYKNGIYLAMASPASGQARLEAQMRGNADGNAYSVDDGLSGLFGTRTYGLEGYCICNLRPAGERGFQRAGFFSSRSVSYEATLVFGYGTDKTDGELYALALPVRAYETAREGWVVERAGDAVFLDAPFDRGWLSFWPFEEVKPLRQYEAKGSYGRVTLDAYSVYAVEGNNGCYFFKNTGEDIFSILAGGAGDAADHDTVNSDAVFEYAEAELLVRYDARFATAGAPKGKAGFVCVKMPDGEMPSFPEDVCARLERGMANETGGSDECSWTNRYFAGETFDGVLKDDFRCVMTRAQQYGEIDADCAVRIYWDGVMVDELRLEEVYGGS